MPYPWGMICICVVLVALIGFAVYHTFFARRKKGKSCGCDCAHCGGSCGCGNSSPSAKSQKKTPSQK